MTMIRAGIWPDIADGALIRLFLRGLCSLFV
jgi:hypothetical protein